MSCRLVKNIGYPGTASDRNQIRKSKPEIRNSKFEIRISNIEQGISNDEIFLSFPSTFIIPCSIFVFQIWLRPETRQESVVPVVFFNT